MQRFAEAKAELIRRAAAAGTARAGTERSGPDSAALTFLGQDTAELAGFLADYYRDLEFPDLAERDPGDLAGAALAHLELATRRPQGTAVVRAYTPEAERDGWTSPHSALDIATDDMPFLVDSVTAELVRDRRQVNLVVHPAVAVLRDVAGALIEVHDEPDDPGAHLTRESWIHVEIDLEPSREELERIEGNIRRVLADVTAAYEDWPRMRARAESIADELGEEPPPVPLDEVEEVDALLAWLRDDNFTFLGYREYELVDPEDRDDTKPDSASLRAVPGTGLGILRGDPPASRALRTLSPAVRVRVREPRLLVLTKANSRSTVHRRAYLDYIGVKHFDAHGHVDGERRFLGLFTAGAYTQSVRAVPFLRRKVDAVLDMSGYPPDSHNGKDLLQFLETYPRDELFQMDPEEILPIAMQVLHIQERRQVRVFLRRDVYGRFMSCLVYLPRDRYSTTVRLAMESALRDAFAAEHVDYTALVSESDLARLHFVVRVPQGTPLPEVDHAELEARLAEATRTWLDRLTDALTTAVGEERAVRLLRLYGDGIPEGYKEDFPPRTAVPDIERLESMPETGPVAVHLYAPPWAARGEYRFKVYRTGGPVALSRALPVLQRMGVDVVDENVYDIRRSDGTVTFVHDFGFRLLSVPASTPDDLRERFEQTFLAVWGGEAESDGFNALVPAAGMTWRQVVVLRAYAKYLRQAGSTFSSAYVEQCVVANPTIALALIRLFEIRHDPAHVGDRDADAAAVVELVQSALDEVESLDQDRILRSFLALVLATLRTSAFQRDADGERRAYTAFKVDPHAIPDLPKPLPHVEVWVYAPRVEGVHLRFGAVARGGLRWSDRREDFRTEVLGLVKAQAVKNAVIVPTGAKGGFVVKESAVDPADREAVLAEGVECYRMFVSALLDVTDNRVGGVVVPPEDVVRHDGDDTYLVVAADKGTAAFSDLANEISVSRGFWLGDAFASGGSAGYDHKEMGITARGAWESVKRHFRELGVDTQAQDFTVVGIGDMSGDVFGNGMLLSPHIRLVAAFDHRHVFLDPDPDAADSFVERTRLFGLNRSSWADYDTSLISAGGGVYPRTLKSIPISAEVRKVLGMPDEVAALTPAEVIRAILAAPVDLLWNGGIGTYVKSERETNADVGDKSTDAVRVDATALRCRVVGEGGNLGMTQLGRVAAARAGVRLNTDAIDNSAGVDTSDHEVNLKILLDHAVREGRLPDRDALLREMTDEVADLVLADNYDQNVMLGNARSQAGPMLPVHQRMIRALEAARDLDRAIEFLPPDSELDALRAAGAGLTSPELAVLSAYVKLALTDDMLATGLADEPWAAAALAEYFPPQVTARFGDRMAEHPLRREIITTAVVNGLVNSAGSSFVFRAIEETGADSDDAVRAYAVVRDVFGLPSLWARIDALDNIVPTAVQSALWLESRRVLDRGVRWVLSHRSARIDVLGEVAHFAAVGALIPQVPDMLRGVESERLDERARELGELGAPTELAREVAALLDAFPLLDVVEIAGRVDVPAEAVARVYYVLSDRYDVDTFLTRITALPRGDRWAALARSSLRYDLYAAMSGITEKILRATDAGAPPEQRIEAWETRNASGIGRARATFEEIAANESFDLATLSVALRAIRTLVNVPDQAPGPRAD